MEDSERDKLATVNFLFDPTPLPPALDFDVAVKALVSGRRGLLAPCSVPAPLTLYTLLSGAHGYFAVVRWCSRRTTRRRMGTRRSPRRRCSVRTPRALATSGSGRSGSGSSTKTRKRARALPSIRSTLRSARPKFSYFVFVSIKERCLRFFNAGS